LEDQSAFFAGSLLLLRIRPADGLSTKSEARNPKQARNPKAPNPKRTALARPPAAVTPPAARREPQASVLGRLAGVCYAPGSWRG
jgi:hypothetical protein